MTATAVETWTEENQRYLVAALEPVRHALERVVTPNGHSTNDPEPADATLDAIRSEMAAPPALEVLCRRFGLSPFERDLLLLCAGVELDSGIGTLFASAHGDPNAAYATFSLALAALPGAHWSALTPQSPLRRWRLVHVDSRGSLTAAPVRIDERILHYLAGVHYVDERLTGFVRAAQGYPGLVPSHRSLADRVAAEWSHESTGEPLRVIQLCGDDRQAVSSITAAACEATGLSLHIAEAAPLPTSADELATLAILWEREASLGHAALLIDWNHPQSGDATTETAVSRLIDATHGAIAVARAEPLRSLRRPVLRLDVEKPTADEQRVLWETALGPLARATNGSINSLVSQFSMGADTIREATLECLAGQSAGENALWDACRAQTRPRLDDLAHRIEPAASWDDLVLPLEQRRILSDVAVHVRRRSVVYESWGFAAKSSRGLGISALFSGPSGTGKTMAAEVLANELRLDLYRIDLSAVISKYIGETEKNLRRVFDAAEGGGAILLFDEADALFGKRSEVKDSHDRYANIDISYLLQRMEAYRGLAILTTNMKSALDSAFLHRIRFIAHFPFPDTAQRTEIWQRIFPSETPTEGLNVDKLARLNVAGGTIRNIGMNAAFLAADSGEPVGMAHLLHAARSECAKLEKPLTDAEIGGWA